MKRKGFATESIHNENLRNYNELVPPIYLTSTYTFSTFEDGQNTFAGERKQYVYGRMHNPTQTILEECLAKLEKTEAGLVVASGMAALAATLYTLLEVGDQIIVHHQMYGNSYKLIVEELPKQGYDIITTDLTDITALSKLVSNRTKLIFCETPTNPTLRFINIEAISNMLKSYKTLLVVDNTIFTPYLYNPISHGADIVIHSLTKYINGHGDALGGAILSSNALIQEIRKRGLRYQTGATISPFTCFLILRGIKTLSIRMEKHCLSALSIIDFLKAHPKVSQVYYPELSSQYKYPGGLVSFELIGGIEMCKNLVNACELIQYAVSFGDAETLIEHPGTMTHATYSEQNKVKGGISDSLLRLSLGLEDVEDIIQDLNQALNVA